METNEFTTFASELEKATPRISALETTVAFLLSLEALRKTVDLDAYKGMLVNLLSELIKGSAGRDMKPDIEKTMSRVFLLAQQLAENTAEELSRPTRD